MPIVGSDCGHGTFPGIPAISEIFLPGTPVKKNDRWRGDRSAAMLAVVGDELPDVSRETHGESPPSSPASAQGGGGDPPLRLSTGGFRSGRLLEKMGWAET
jgi:hypothetical protein